jgi:hypothetical protein
MQTHYITVPMPPIVPFTLEYCDSQCPWYKLNKCCLFGEPIHDMQRCQDCVDVVERAANIIQDKP